METRVSANLKPKKSPTVAEKNVQNIKKAQKKKKKQKKQNAIAKENNILDINIGNNEQDFDGFEPVSGNNEVDKGDSPIDKDSSSPVNNVPFENDNRPQEKKLQSKVKDQTISSDNKRRPRPLIKTAFANSPRIIKRNIGSNNCSDKNRRVLGNKTQKGALPPIKQQTFVEETFNESIRWEYQILDDSDAEEERMQIYKMNRRKRYLAAQNAMLAELNSQECATRSSASSMSYSPSLNTEEGHTDAPVVMDVQTPRESSASRPNTPRGRSPRPAGKSRSPTPQSARLEDIQIDSVGKNIPTLIEWSTNQ